MNEFKELELSSHLLESIKHLGFERPTEIQIASIPLIMQGKDVIGESATGSGKTLAFSCGIIEKVVPKKGLQALVLTPTRELALQVKESIKKLSHKKYLEIVTVYGGVSIDRQIHELRKAEIVVATPGRLLDHVKRKTVDLSKIDFLVLDEADRMLDMGFIDDVEKIISLCPKKRQTLFFSATISSRIRSLADNYMHHPIKVLATKMVDPKKLEQVYYDISSGMKLSLLVHLLEKERSGLVLVFCNTRKNTDFVLENLKTNKINAIVIHGGLSQHKRTKTINMFSNAKLGVLVCTDVAARGLHINNVSHVYNYDLPRDAKDYIHRIGRTARAGEKGKVVNLLGDKDHDNFSKIWREYREFSIKKMEIPKMNRINIIKTERHRPHHNIHPFRKHSDLNKKRWNN